jgi:phosphate transport system ATP-binding protein
MTNRTHISARDLNVYYGEVQALRDINIDIPERKVTAIIGPSGCGKTTLLRSFNRLLETLDGIRITGKVLVDGENIYEPGTDVTQVRKKVGLLSQRPYPLPMSIADNVTYGPRIHGLRNRKSLDGVAEHYLKVVGLWDEVKDRLHEPASRLSIGQQQRLCLARGLAVEPEVILADEPTSALDPVSSQHIENRFRALKERYTVIVVTHILRQAKRLADYVVFLYLGELVEHGPSEEIFEKPREKKTQDYIRGVIS